MKKKILFSLWVLFGVVMAQSQALHFTTTSSSATWSPHFIDNRIDPTNSDTNSILHWSASNSLIGTVTGDGPVDITPANYNTPELDFSANNGSDIIIDVTDDNNFQYLWNITIESIGELTSVDISSAVELRQVRLYNNNLTSIDLSNLVNLYTIYLYGNNLTTLDLSNNTNLILLRVDDNSLSSLDIGNNPRIEGLWANNNNLSSSELDNLIIQIDNNGMSDPRGISGGEDIRIANNPGNLTSASLTAYNSLIAKGWTIDVPAPPTPPKLDMTGNGVVITSGNTASSADGTDFGDVATGVSLSHTFTITNSGGEDLIITSIDVTGATEFTTDLVAQTIAPAGTVDFTVTFAPTTTGQRGTNIRIYNNDSDFILHVEGYGIIGTGANIDVQGGNPLVSIPGDGDGTNTPSTTDDTDFGQTASGTTITKTFTIENLGDEPLILNGTDLVAISGANAADFTISALPATPVAVGATTTFEVTFNANSLGVRAATLTIESNDPNDPAYTFNIQAESTQATGPKINVTGNGISIPSGNTPIIADDTDFGQVAIGSSITKTFTIENVGDSDLTVAIYGVNPPPYEVVTPPNSPVSPGSSTTLEITFTPQNIGVQNVQVVMINNDSDENPFILNLTAEGIQGGSSGTIDVQGNGVSIANGDTTPDVSDDTDFSSVLNNTTKTITYTVQNTHATEDLTINSITLPYSDAEFVISNDPTPVTLSPGASTTFSIDFTPLSTGNYTAHVEIDHSETANNKNPFKFDIAGKGADVVVSGDIMITQYYNGFSGSDNWVEIKNISGNPIAANTYYLALYSDSDIPDITTQGPTASIAIPAMATDEVLLFKNSAAALPASGNLGGATQFTTPVCNFDGNDVILISAANDATCYANRQDIIGDISVPVVAWGKNASFIKGGCATEIPHANFNENDWIQIFPLNAVDIADANTNLALGTQVVGPTELVNPGDPDPAVAWSNLSPDQSRTVILPTSFTGATRTVSACNLIVNPGVNAVFDSNGVTNHSIIIYGDLIVNGSLTIGDTESLVTIDPFATLGNITKIESSTTLYNLHDNTYWCSPVVGSQLQNVFPNVEPSRIFEYKASHENPIYAGTNYRYWWNKPTGSMDTGYGYAVEGPAAPVDSNDYYNNPFKHIVSFSGIPNNGNLSINVYYKGSLDSGTQNDNFNLIGNPYPTAIDIQSFLSNNSVVNEIALWNHATPIDGGTSGEFTDADYVYYNTTGSTTQGVTQNIGSGQGFMTRTIGYGNITFSNEYKMVDANTQFFKSELSKDKRAVEKEKKDRLWLRLSNGQKNKSNILIGFLKGATDGVDNYYDSYGMDNEKSLNLYSRIDGSDSKYLIQGLGIFNNEKKVTLGIDTKLTGDLTIGIAAMEGAFKDSDVYLTDNLLGITHNLKDSDYKFKQTATGDFPERFTLQFATAALGIDDFTKENDFNIANVSDGFRINASKLVSKVKVYDMLGRMILQKKPNQQSFNVQTENIKQGTVLIFELTLENGAIINKKTIRY